MYEASAALAAAVRDYRWLLDRGYGESSSLKLVGDHHQLDKDERTVLFRGVASARASAERRALLAPGAAGGRLLLDAYNQILTVMHYLVGKPLFLGTDGLLRDAGAAHGRIADQGLFGRSLELLAAALKAAAPSTVIAFFDAPVPGSARHGAALLATLAARGLPASLRLERSADAPLKGAGPGEFVATGDSAILDALLRASAEKGPENAAAGPLVFDAARAGVELAFGPRPWLDLGRLAGTQSSSLDL